MVSLFAWEARRSSQLDMPISMWVVGDHDNTARQFGSGRNLPDLPLFPNKQVFTIMTPPEQGVAAHELVLTMSPGARQTYALAGTQKYEIPVNEVTLAGESTGKTSLSGCR